MKSAKVRDGNRKVTATYDALEFLEHLRYEFLPPPSTGPPNWLARREAEQYWQQHADCLPPPEADDNESFEQASPPDDYDAD